MLNVLFKKKGSLSLRAWWPQVMILPVALLIGMGQAQAQSATCVRTQDLHSNGGWSMVPGGTFFKNGQIIGRTSATAQFFLPLAHSDTVQVMASGLTTNNPHDAVPLSGMPGLGLVVRWAGHSISSGVGWTPLAPSAAVGTIVSNRSWFKVLEGKASANYTMIQRYDYELIIIDETIYRGGKLQFSDPNQVRVLTSVKTGANNYQQCMNGFVDLMAALTGTVQVPELPKPALPSCKFSTSTLKQSITLGPVDPSQIPSSSTLRPSGEAGQNAFLIEGTGCTKDTKLSFYFTDTRDMATPKNYLLTSNPAVGIRLFHRGEYDPVPFGPPPSGSWVPPRYAPTVGPATTDGATLSTGFTAQYVRLPNKTEADIRPGPLEAAATFVIVYP